MLLWQPLHAKLPLSIQIEGAMITDTCLKTGLDSRMTIRAGDKEHSILLTDRPRTQDCLHSANTSPTATAKHAGFTSS